MRNSFAKSQRQIILINAVVFLISCSCFAAINPGSIAYQEPSSFGRGCSGNNVQFINATSASGGSGQFFYSWEDSIPGTTTAWRVISNASSSSYAGSIIYDKYHYFRRKAADLANTTDIAYSNILSTSIYGGSAGSIVFSSGVYAVSLNIGEQPPLMQNQVAGFVEYPPMFYTWEKKKGVNGLWQDLPGAFGKINFQAAAENTADTFYYRRYVLDGCQPLPGGSNLLSVVYRQLLPVTWVAANAVAQQGSVVIKWHVANEINNLGFSVHRSYDGHHFEKIGLVSSLNSSLQGRYFFEDRTIHYSNRNIFYKIQQTYLDGQSSFSPVMKVTIMPTLSFQITPNPANNEIRILQKGSENSVLDIKIIDQTGRIVLRRSNVRTQAFTIPVKQLSAGTYTLMLTADNENISERIIIRH